MNALRIILLLVIATSPAHAQDVVNIGAPACKPGAHEPSQGPFGLFVFCDDALGTNVALYVKDLGVPIAGPYDLGKRFWQGQKWSYDATSYAWLKDGRLLLATSAVYGSGAVYLLDPETQKAKVVVDPQKGGCVLTLKSVTETRAVAEATSCEQRKDYTVEFAI